MNKKQLSKYLQNTEFDVQSAKANLFACDLCFRAYVDSKLMKNNAIDPIYCFVNNNDNKFQFSQIISEEALHNYIEKISFQYLKNPNWLFEKMEEFDKAAEDFDEIWRYYQKNKEALNDDELIQLFDKIINISRKNIVHWSYGEDKGVFISEKIVNFLINKHIKTESEAREIVGTLTHPDFLSALNKERTSYLSICLYISKKSVKNSKELLEDKKLKKMVDSYIKNYFWIKTDFYEEKNITPNDLLDDVKKEIGKKKTSEIKLELDNIKKTISKISKEKKLILSKLKLSAEEKKSLSFVSYIVARQDIRKVYMMKQWFYMFSFFKDVAKRINVDYDYLVAHSVDDARKIIEKRGKIKTKFGWHFIVFERGKKNKIFYDSDAQELFGALKINNQDAKEIRGMVASRGKENKIRGIIKIVSNPNEQKLNQGEILVTSMTRTEFLPIMRKAKAIITNEGGIACHASIVSRELGIPCIIGTKNATKILKDGDDVEMDMNSGVIKIVK